MKPSNHDVQGALRSFRDIARAATWPVAFAATGFVAPHFFMAWSWLSFLTGIAGGLLGACVGQLVERAVATERGARRGR